jgi:hypothetical protein
MRHPKATTRPKRELPPLTPAISDLDRIAFEKAIAWVRQHGEPIEVRAIETMLRQGLAAAGEHASYTAQCRTLRLRPWQCPPCHAGDEVAVDIYGRRPGELELRDRLVSAGLSVYEPDPVSALARVHIDTPAA